MCADVFLLLFLHSLNPQFVNPPLNQGSHRISVRDCTSKPIDLTYHRLHPRSTGQTCNISWNIFDSHACVRRRRRYILFILFILVYCRLFVGCLSVVCRLFVGKILDILIFVIITDSYDTITLCRFVFYFSSRFQTYKTSPNGSNGNT